VARRGKHETFDGIRGKESVNKTPILRLMETERIGNGPARIKNELGEKGAGKSENRQKLSKPRPGGRDCTKKSVLDR